MTLQITETVFHSLENMFSAQPPTVREICSKYIFWESTFGCDHKLFTLSSAKKKTKKNHIKIAKKYYTNFIHFCTILSVDMNTKLKSVTFILRIFLESKGKTIS